MKARTDPRTEPRTIILVTEATNGGVGKHVLDLAEYLPRRGYDVLLVHARGRPEHDFRDRVHRHREFGYSVATFDVGREPGMRDIPGARELRKAIKVFGGADVLHGHSSKGGALARLSRWRVAQRVVYSPHAFYTMSPQLNAVERRAYGAIEHALSFMTDRIITVSQDEYEHALALGIATDKLTVIRNGIRVRQQEDVAHVRSTARAALGLGDEDIVIGFLGRLSAQKAPDIALQAFRRIRADYPAARLVMVGDGPEADVVRRTICELDMQDSMQWIPKALGYEIIPAFDIFLLSSRYEAFPYVLLEALEGGCAIVTTDVGGTADTVRHGSNGFVVPRLSAEALATSALTLCRDRCLLDRMRRASRSHAAQFSVEQMLEHTVEVYRSLWRPGRVAGGHPLGDTALYDPDHCSSSRLLSGTSESR